MCSYLVESCRTVFSQNTFAVYRSKYRLPDDLADDNVRGTWIATGFSNSARSTESEEFPVRKLVFERLQQGFNSLLV